MTNGAPAAVGLAVLTLDAPETRILAVRSMGLLGLLGGTLRAVAPGSTYCVPTMMLVVIPLVPADVTNCWLG